MTAAITTGVIFCVGICIGFIAGAVWATLPHDDDDDMDWGGVT